MKKITSILLLLLIVLTVNSQQQQRFAIKSGHVEYKLTGNSTGTKSIWWDDYGHKSRTEIKSKTVTVLFGIKSEQEINSVDINVGAKYWSANLIENTGQNGVIPFYNTGYELLNDLTEAEQERIAYDILEQLGGEKLDNENILGYSCDVVKLLGAKSWTHKGVVLKTTAKLLGIEANEIATKFDKNASVSSSKFSVLANIKYEDMSDVYQQIYEESSYDQDSDDDDDYKPAQLNYPFDKFKQAVLKVKDDGFKKLAILSEDGDYVASFMKGFGDMINIVAIGADSGIEEEFKEFELFTNNGHKCGFSNNNEGSGTMLIVNYKEHDMYIIINSLSGYSKEKLIKISDLMKF